jgi:hypothetical protein
MGYPLNNLPFLFLALLSGIAMLVESFVILRLQKQVVPLPTKVLYWIGVGLVGKEKSAMFIGKTRLKHLRTYAFFALFFGVSLLASSIVYLYWFLAQ